MHMVSTSFLLSHKPLSAFTCPSDLFCSPEDVYVLIIQSPNDSPPSEDQITSKMLKGTAQSVSLYLYIFLSSSLRTGIYPRETL